MHFLLLFAATVNCPALDTATVAGAYGEMQAVVTHSQKDAGYLCRFTGKNYELTLAVSPLTAADHFGQVVGRVCADSRETTSVRGIGNEAVLCTRKIVSRVRDQVFILALHTTDKAAEEKSILDKNMALAEQVAGNLF